MSVSQGECLVILMGPHNESHNKLEINLPKWRASPLKNNEFLGGIQQTFFVNSKVLNKKRPSRLKMHRCTGSGWPTLTIASLRSSYAPNHRVTMGPWVQVVKLWPKRHRSVNCQQTFKEDYHLHLWKTHLHLWRTLITIHPSEELWARRNSSNKNFGSPF